MYELLPGILHCLTSSIEFRLAFWQVGAPDRICTCTPFRAAILETALSAIPTQEQDLGGGFTPYIYKAGLKRSKLSWLTKYFVFHEPQIGRAGNGLGLAADELIGRSALPV